jgi:hypothetical protein
MRYSKNEGRLCDSPLVQRYGLRETWSSNLSGANSTPDTTYQTDSHVMVLRGLKLDFLQTTIYPMCEVKPSFIAKHNKYKVLFSITQQKTDLQLQTSQSQRGR